MAQEGSMSPDTVAIAEYVPTISVLSSSAVVRYQGCMRCMHASRVVRQDMSYGAFEQRQAILRQAQEIMDDGG